jgi:GNAT superfamily N-acetyltransferase
MFDVQFALSVRRHTMNENSPMGSAMFKIEPYQPKDLPLVVSFVAAIQEHERTMVPELRSGEEIGKEYALSLLKSVAEKNGAIFMARSSDDIVGFVCSWVDQDEDPLLQDNMRNHAYVSDIFVTSEHRGKGVGRALLDAIEITMRDKGCQRIRVCAKASNREAVGFYDSNGYSRYEIVFSKIIGV